MEKLHLTCEYCQHWKETAKVNSGLKLHDGVTPWYYAVGECSCEKSPHFFNDEKRRLAENPRYADLMHQPSWGNCYMHKNARVGAAMRRINDDYYQRTH